ncbi:MAG: ubiquinone/menaquinone biosynthesis methylase-like protein [uncultured bacterium]|nr:MAG: ubiquinone/menaquinone biosynthesis methylase-like protein [uncultured bacterium]
MAKHDLLTEEEFSAYKAPARAIQQLNQFAASKGKSAAQVKVLDWGCGRGRFVLKLRELGFDAYGVDIDPEPVNNGLPLFEKKGYHNKPLSVISAEGRTIYEDGFFDFVMTDNVLEHVSDLGKVMNEINRLTSKDGGGYHIFPAQRQFIEGHLFMPFVHWLPEGGLRKAVIRNCVKNGTEPHWTEVEGRGIEEKTRVYYEYSTDHIFYRPFKMISDQFKAVGFKVSFLSLQNPAVQKHKMLGPLARFVVTKPVINWLLLTFKQVELLIKRID